MKSIELKITAFLLSIILLILAENTFSQDKDKIEKFDPYKVFEKKTKTFSNDQIDSLINYDSTLKLFFTGFGHDKIKLISDGYNFTLNASKKDYKKEMIGKASFLPLWKDNIGSEEFGFGVSLIKLPFKLNMDVRYSNLKLKDEPKKFALPPLLPENSSIKYELDIFSGSWSFNWIPFVISTRPANFLDIKEPALYFIPAIGGIYNYSRIYYNERKSEFHSLGINAEINLRYRLFFVRTSYKKYLYYEDQIDTELEIGFGIWFSTN